MNSTPKGCITGRTITHEELEKVYWLIPASCFVSSSVLAHALSMPKRRVMNIITKLKQRGVVETSHDGVRQKRGSATQPPIKLNQKRKCKNSSFQRFIRSFAGGLFATYRKHKLLKKLGLRSRPTKK